MLGRIVNLSLEIVWFKQTQMGAQLTGGRAMMVNLTGCPDIWLNIVGVLVRVFLDETTISIERPSKADCPSHCGWVSFNQLTTYIELKGGARENSFSLFDCL
jgi:hypothetical protein